MNAKPEYSLQEFWADLRSVNQARHSFGLIPSFAKQVKSHFECLHGVSDYVTWRYSIFMLVMIYITTNQRAFDVGDLAVAGSEKEDGTLISDKLAGRVLRYAVENPMMMVEQFPPPSFFIDDAT